MVKWWITQPITAKILLQRKCFVYIHIQALAKMVTWVLKIRMWVQATLAQIVIIKCQQLVLLILLGFKDVNDPFVSTSVYTRCINVKLPYSLLTPIINLISSLATAHTCIHQIALGYLLHWFKTRIDFVIGKNILQICWLCTYLQVRIKTRLFMHNNRN